MDGNETTRLTSYDLQQMGFAVVFYAVSALFSAAKAVSDTLGVTQGRHAQVARGAMMSYADFSRLVDLDGFTKLDDDFGWS